MSDHVLKVDVAEWVRRAEAAPISYQQRQTVEITLNAIAMAAPINVEMFLKGGILMGLAYDSPRHTTDIDLTTALAPGRDVAEQVRKLLDSTLPRAATALGHDNLVVKVHSVKSQPRANIADAKFPALKLKIASAKRGTTQEKALQKGLPRVLIDADISFNEPLLQIQVLELTGGRELRAYGLGDLIAEKYLAIIQQVPRKRHRPQDVYDLDRLIGGHKVDNVLQAQILEALIAKCQARQIEPTRASLEDPEIKRRAGADWMAMVLEIGELPDFEDCFLRISEFYRSLPWRIQ
ncbi:MAG: nucleotidyl transferase AbiEii/AbiGii toxin family protein [Acidobacteriia bacterium]|nr:nucleotidyl transferase AbiEii/AbiGii toxin family protein [Terriglobia bacterium]